METWNFMSMPNAFLLKLMFWDCNILSAFRTVLEHLVPRNLFAKNNTLHRTRGPSRWCFRSRWTGIWISEANFSTKNKKVRTEHGKEAGGGGRCKGLERVQRLRRPFMRVRAELRPTRRERQLCCKSQAKSLLLFLGNLICCLHYFLF